MARRGRRSSTSLINRALIEQALGRQKMSVTAAEIDEEIDAVAQRFGISREGWLRTLDKERGISPAQYAREIIYPALALRKLCSEPGPGDPQGLAGRLRVAVRRQAAVPDDPGGQAGQGDGDLGGAAQEPRRLRDDGQGASRWTPAAGRWAACWPSRSPGTPIPRNLSDSAFQQLVDGDPKDRDPSHKPKDGDFTGPIQAGEAAWVILRREELIPATKNVSLKDEHVRKQIYEMIYQVKLKEAMEKIFEELIKEAAIENRLTGTIKMANEEQRPGLPG